LLKDYTYNFDKVVIGSNLDAIIYAYKTSSHILFNDVASIFSFDATDYEIDLGDVKFEAGSNKLEIWRQLSYILNMRGLNSFGSDVESIRLNLEENEISIFSKFFSRQNLRFSTLHVFDTHNVHGLPFSDFEVEGYRVFDWFAVKSGTKHRHDYLHDDSEFIRKIYFYLSPRIAGNKQYKDLVAESFLTKKQLGDVNYSDSISRLKILHMMKEAGIKGTGHGNGYNLPLKIELQKREVLPSKVTNYGEEGVII
tara:strand:+ start:199 stop:957 length:759 start_codon:yes stop_codon:yes gene_type:complete